MPEAGETDDGTTSIGDIAREFGISVREIELYEDRGLLQPRCIGRMRAYGPRERLHLKMILKGKELGFTLSEIADILAAHSVEAPAADFEADEFSAANLGALALQLGGQGAHDAKKLDVATGLQPEQIAAQIDHLERQRQALDDAIHALREAHQRRIARNARRAPR